MRTINVILVVLLLAVVAMGTTTIVHSTDIHWTGTGSVKTWVFATTTTTTSTTTTTIPPTATKQVTGALNPTNATGYYQDDGQLNGERRWSRIGGGWYVWVSGGIWYLNVSDGGSAPGAGWNRNDTANGIYSVQSGVTGTPTVASVFQHNGWKTVDGAIEKDVTGDYYIAGTNCGQPYATNIVSPVYYLWYTNNYYGLPTWFLTATLFSDTTGWFNVSTNPNGTYTIQGGTELGHPTIADP